MYDDLNCNDANVKTKISQRNKLYTKLKDERDEIKNLKIRLTTLGGNDRLNEYKDQYKDLVDKNYVLYEEVKTSQGENDRLTKEVEALVSADSEYEQRLSELKAQIDNEK